MQLIIALALPLAFVTGTEWTPLPTDGPTDDPADTPDVEECAPERMTKTKPLPKPTYPKCSTEVGPVYTCTTCEYEYSTTIICKPTPKKKMKFIP